MHSLLYEVCPQETIKLELDVIVLANSFGQHSAIDVTQWGVWPWASPIRNWASSDGVWPPGHTQKMTEKWDFLGQAFTTLTRGHLMAIKPSIWMWHCKVFYGILSISYTDWQWKRRAQLCHKAATSCGLLSLEEWSLWWWSHQSGTCVPVNKLTFSFKQP